MFELDNTGMASLHVLYGILVFSQSEPFIVSYMCQRQLSSPMFPSAALIPPCAATVWLRVGNTLVIQAVVKPSAARPKVARSPAPPAPTTITSYSCCIKSYSAVLETPVQSMRNSGKMESTPASAPAKAPVFRAVKRTNLNPLV